MRLYKSDVGDLKIGKSLNKTSCKAQYRCSRISTFDRESIARLFQFDKDTKMLLFVNQSMDRGALRFQTYLKK